MTKTATKKTTKKADVKTVANDFTAGDTVVYPAHGVGHIEGVETMAVSGMEVDLYTISFAKDKGVNHGTARQ